MVGKIKKSVEKGLEFLKDIPLSSDEKIRFQHYSIFLLLGLPTMVVFCCYNLIKGNYILCLFILSSAIGTLTGWFIIFNFKKSNIVYQINCLLFSLLMLYMLFIGGEAGSKSVWMYTFPLISFFLLGKNVGLRWNVAFFLIAMILFWNPLNLAIAYDYPPEFKVRFIASFSIVAAITYWFEYFRDHYRISVEFKNKNLEKEIAIRRVTEREREKLIDQLQIALHEIKALNGIVPICSNCKKIRDDKGYWNLLETYIEEHSEASFSHSMCPECSDKYYGDQQWYIKRKKKL